MAMDVYLRSGYIHAGLKTSVVLTMVVLGVDLTGTLLVSVQDAVKREYDYIMVGVYTIPRSCWASLPNIRTRVIGGGVSIKLYLQWASSGLHPQNAGLVVATRLSEDPTVSVLVLKAGREPQRRLSQCVFLPDPLFSFLFSLTLLSHARDVCEEPFQSRF